MRRHDSHVYISNVDACIIVPPRVGAQSGGMLDGPVYVAVRNYLDSRGIVATYDEEDDICHSVAGRRWDGYGGLMQTVEDVMRNEWLTVRLDHQADFACLPYTSVFVR